MGGITVTLVGLPDHAAGEVKYAIEVPMLGSLILKHSIDAPLAGLDTVPRENWPPVPITFWSFRIMVGMGFLMVGLGLFSLWSRWRGTLYESRLLHIFATAMGPAGFIAVLAGWVYHEGGREPFLVFCGCAPSRPAGPAGRARGGVVAARLRDRLFHRLCRGPDLPVPLDGAAAASR